MEKKLGKSNFWPQKRWAISAATKQHFSSKKMQMGMYTQCATTEFPHFGS